MKKRALKVTAVLLLTAVFLYFFARSADWPTVWRDFRAIRLEIVPVLLLLAALHFFTRSFRWKYLLFHEKGDVRFSNMVEANIVGFTVSAVIPGRLGEIVKPLYLARKEGMRKGFVIGTVVVERIFDIFTMCFLLAVFLAARPLYSSVLRVGPDSARLLTFWGIAAGAFAGVLLAVILLMYIFREKALRAVSFLLKPFPGRFEARVLSLAGEFIEGLKFFHSLRNLAIYAFLSAVVWLGIMLFYWILFIAFETPIPYFLLIPYIFLTMVGASIPTPGMVGGFHYFSKLGMTTLFGIDPNRAVVMTLVGHALQIGVTCCLGYVILAKEGLSLLELRKMGENEKT